jgi:quinol monooxygenase YgiN
MRVPLVTLHLSSVRPSRVPWAVTRMVLDRPGLAGTPGLRFAKLLGTGDGRTFDLRDADPCTWGLLAVWEDAAALAGFERRSPVARAWARAAEDRWRADLVPVTSRGRWSGRDPFTPTGPVRTEGTVAAITRARLRPRLARTFRRAVPPVVADLHADPGVLLSVGIGEAPVGLQGTFSMWESASALRDFAYRRSPHTEVVRRTAAVGWYAEELFARFAVLQTTGTLWGGDPVRRP